MTNFESVKKFMQTFGQEVRAKASFPNEKIIHLRLNLIEEELKNSGKPEDIVKKISLGKINKFKEDNSLMLQDWVMEPKMKVKDVVKSLEISNLQISNFIRLKIGE